jgi:hypothetical protein
MNRYVTYNAAGELTGAYIQDVHPDHADCHIEVDGETYDNWHSFCANEARDGLTPLPPSSTAQPTEAQIVAAYEKALDDHIDATARAYGYISIITAISYAEEPAVPKFQAEGQALRAWRSLCYAYGHEVMAAVKAGERTMPTVEGLIEELPPLALDYPGTFAMGAATM